MLLAVGVWSTTPIVEAQGGLQIFGEYDYGSYLGKQVDMALSNPFSPSGTWVLAVNGIKNRAQNVFIESGASYHLYPSGTTGDDNEHPYGAGQDRYGSYSYFVATGFTINFGQYYHYYNNNYSDNNWQSVWCGDPGCYQMRALDAGFRTFEALDSGLEAADPSGHGTVYANNNGFFAFGADHYDPWCWNAYVATGTTNQPTACENRGDGWPDSWTASY